MGRMQNVEVDSDDIKTIAKFKVIEIMGEKDPYPTLLGYSTMTYPYPIES
jgi:hypothetical protein